MLLSFIKEYVKNGNAKQKRNVNLKFDLKHVTSDDFSFSCCAGHYSLIALIPNSFEDCEDEAIPKRISKSDPHTYLILL